MKTTCQICAREIKSKTGVIAHHGYQRPGNGWQTSSCMGARHLPYERSRDLIPTVIATYGVWLQNNVDKEKELLDTPPATFTTKPNYYGETTTYERPADFDAVDNVAPEGHSYHSGYAREHYWHVRQVRNNIRDITSEIERLQRRYNAWVAPNPQ